MLIPAKRRSTARSALDSSQSNSRISAGRHRPTQPTMSRPSPRISAPGPTPVRANFASSARANYFYREMNAIFRWLLLPFLLLFGVELLAIGGEILRLLGIFNYNILF